VDGWETVLAAVGGVLLGGGLGLAVALRRERRSHRRQLQMESRLRVNILPHLVRHAESLGIAARAILESKSPMDRASELVDAIDRHRELSGIAFSDTLDVTQERLKGTADKAKP
jgi:CHASE1-domain containing sensor protein